MDHAIQELTIARYGGWVDFCRWVRPGFLRRWLLSFAPKAKVKLRGKCWITHVKDGETKTTSVRSDTEIKSGSLVFGCAHCDFGFKWENGVLTPAQNRFEAFRVTREGE